MSGPGKSIPGPSQIALEPTICKKYRSLERFDHNSTFY